MRLGAASREHPEPGRLDELVLRPNPGAVEPRAARQAGQPSAGAQADAKARLAQEFRERRFQDPVQSLLAEAWERRAGQAVLAAEALPAKR